MILESRKHTDKHITRLDELQTIRQRLTRNRTLLFEALVNTFKVKPKKSPSIFADKPSFLMIHPPRLTDWLADTRRLDSHPARNRSVLLSQTYCATMQHPRQSTPHPPPGERPNQRLRPQRNKRGTSRSGDKCCRPRVLGETVKPYIKI